MDKIKKLDVYEFNFVSELEPIKNEEWEYKVYDFRDKITKDDAHAYGLFDFCELIDKYHNIPWILALFTDDDLEKPVYIWETNDLTLRINGIWNIDENKVKKQGGRQTECHLNAEILRYYKNWKKVYLYFCDCDSYNYRLHIRKTLIDLYKKSIWDEK